MKISIKNFWAGFTMVELLIVISLIGIVAGMVLVLIDPTAQAQKARDAQRQSHLRQIQTALEMYRNDVNSYPPVPFPACGGAFSHDGVTYLERIPCDPRSGNGYYYAGGGNNYTLAACMEFNRYELASDPDLSNTDPGMGACASNFYYVVNNP